MWSIDDLHCNIHNVWDIRHLALEINETNRNSQVWNMIFIFNCVCPHLPTLQSCKPRDFSKETLKNFKEPGDFNEPLLL